MKAITTKFIFSTDHRPTQIRAWAQTSDNDRQQVTIDYPHGLDLEEAHKQAATALCKKLDWPADMIGGSVRNGYVFVFLPGANFNREPKQA